VLFSSSSGPVIVLNPLTPQSYPTGLILGGAGDFMLNWNTYPGALCYSVYQSVNPDDSFGQYKIVAECIPNPPIDLTSFGPGFFRVSAITLDGETPLSLPIHFNPGTGFECPFFTGTAPVNPVDASVGDNITLGPIPVNEGFGGGQVTYEWRKNGLPYLDTTLTTKNSLEINDVQTTDSGAYSLQIGNEILACDFAVSEDVQLNVIQGLWLLSWNVPVFVPGNPPASQNFAGLDDGFNYGMTRANNGSPNPQVDSTGTQVYTGPAANCNLQILETVDQTSVPDSPFTNWDVIVRVDGNLIIDAHGGPGNPGPGPNEYNFPFTIPESLGAVITVEVGNASRVAGLILNGRLTVV